MNTYPNLDDDPTLAALWNAHNLSNEEIHRLIAKEAKIVKELERDYARGLSQVETARFEHRQKLAEKARKAELANRKRVSRRIKSKADNDGKDDPEAAVSADESDQDESTPSSQDKEARNTIFDDTKRTTRASNVKQLSAKDNTLPVKKPPNIRAKEKSAPSIQKAMGMSTSKFASDRATEAQTAPTAKDPEATTLTVDGAKNSADEQSASPSPDKTNTVVADKKASVSVGEQSTSSLSTNKPHEQPQSAYEGQQGPTSSPEDASIPFKNSDEKTNSSTPITHPGTTSSLADDSSQKTNAKDIGSSPPTTKPPTPQSPPTPDQISDTAQPVQPRKRKRGDELEIDGSFGNLREVSGKRTRKAPSKDLVDQPSATQHLTAIANPSTSSQPGPPKQARTTKSSSQPIKSEPSEPQTVTPPRLAPKPTIASTIPTFPNLAPSRPSPSAIDVDTKPTVPTVPTVGKTRKNAQPTNPAAASNIPATGTASSRPKRRNVLTLKQPKQPKALFPNLRSTGTKRRRAPSESADEEEGQQTGRTGGQIRQGGRTRPKRVKVKSEPPTHPPETVIFDTLTEAAAGNENDGAAKTKEKQGVEELLEEDIGEEAIGEGGELLRPEDIAAARQRHLQADEQDGQAPHHSLPSLSSPQTDTANPHPTPTTTATPKPSTKKPKTRTPVVSGRVQKASTSSTTTPTTKKPAKASASASGKRGGGGKQGGQGGQGGKGGEGGKQGGKAKAPTDPKRSEAMRKAWAKRQEQGTNGRFGGSPKDREAIVKAEERGWSKDV